MAAVTTMAAVMTTSSRDKGVEGGIRGAADAIQAN